METAKRLEAARRALARAEESVGLSSAPSGAGAPAGEWSVPDALSWLFPRGLSRGMTVGVRGSRLAALLVAGIASGAGAWSVFLGCAGTGWAVAASLGVDLDRTVCVPRVGEAARSQVLAAAVDGFDVAVIGAGPAGLTAGLYAARAGLRSAVFEQLSPGGQLAQTERIENYPGFSEGAGGFELAWSMKEQAERFGVQIINEEVSSLDLALPVKQLRTPYGSYGARSVIVATGARPRKLGVPGEAQLTGRGVSYCATCDGSFFRGKTVMVGGGGNTAAADAIYLSRLAERVILVHRRAKLRATPVYHDQLAKLENVSFMWSTEVRALHGEEGKLVSAQVEHLSDGALETVPVDGVFVAVGTQPNTEFLAGALPLDAGGYIAASETGETPIPGVFAAGDVRAKALRQVVTAVSDGAVCAEQAANHVAI